MGDIMQPTSIDGINPYIPITTSINPIIGVIPLRMSKSTPKLTPTKARLVDTWQNELENHSGLVFGHMCNGEKFRKGPVLLCSQCQSSNYVAKQSYDWHITEEEYIIELLKQNY